MRGITVLFHSLDIRFESLGYIPRITVPIPATTVSYSYRINGYNI